MTAQMGYGIPAPDENAGTEVSVVGPVEIENTEDGPITVEVTNVPLPVMGTVSITGSAGLATEAKQDDILTSLADLLTEAAFTAEDFATQTTLAQVLSSLNSVISSGKILVDDADTQTLLGALQTLIDDGFTDLIASVEAIRAQVETSITVDQGAAGAQRWLVDIGENVEVTANVTGVQQIAVSTDVSVVDYDLAASSYTVNIPYNADAQLGSALFTFSTTERRTITISTDDGSYYWRWSDNNATRKYVDFENADVDGGTVLTITVTQTSGPCLMDLTVLSSVSSSLGNNPVLGEGDARIGTVGIDVIDSPSGDSYGRLRVAEPYINFDVTHQYDLAPLRMGVTSDTTGTVVHNSPAATLTAAVGQIVKHQSHNYVLYFPGKSRECRATFCMPTHVAGANYLIGYGDDEDGIFVGRDDGGGYFLLRSSMPVGDVKTYFANANRDTLDGSQNDNNPSGLQIDLTKAQHLVVDFQWLSVGRIRWGFNLGGRFVICHEYDSANSLTSAYMRTGSLPVRYELDNTLGAAPTTLSAICAAVTTEGGADPTGFHFSANTGTTAKSVSAIGIPTPILSIRPKDTFKGQTNRTLISPTQTSLASSHEVLVEVYLGATLTGASWVSSDTDSVVEYDTSATSMSGGKLLFNFYIQQTGGGRSISSEDIADLVISRLANNTLQNLTIAAKRLDNNANVRATIEWVERR